jgi:hypothetical protein
VTRRCEELRTLWLESFLFRLSHTIRKPVSHREQDEHEALMNDTQLGERTCSCGYIWLLQSCTPTKRKENLVCRCGTIFAKSKDGSLTALLLTPKERFVALRRIRYVVGVLFLQAANILRIKLGPKSWLRPHRIVAYRHVHTPVRTFFKIR